MIFNGDRLSMKRKPYMASPSPAPVVFDPYFANVTLLLPLSNSDGKNYGSVGGTMTVGTGGNTGFTSAVSKWGKGSYLCDGTTGYGTLPNSQNGYGIVSQSFTIELWANVTSHGSYGGFLSQADRAGATPVDRGWQFTFYNATDQIWITTNRNATNTSQNLTSAGAITLNTWHHLAITRNSSNRTDIWVDGVSVANTTAITATDIYIEDALAKPMKIGASREGSMRTQTLYMNDVRITQGVCRYTASFAVPTGPFPRN